MSAFLVSENLLNLIVNASSAPNERAFQMLLDQNLRSLCQRLKSVPIARMAMARSYRFRRDTPFEIVLDVFMNEQRSMFKFRADAERTVATQIVKACDCYDYQASGTDDYRDTVAAGLVADVRSRAVIIGGESKGALYDAVLWGF